MRRHIVIDIDDDQVDCIQVRGLEKGRSGDPASLRSVRLIDVPPNDELTQSVCAAIGHLEGTAARWRNHRSNPEHAQRAAKDLEDIAGRLRAAFNLDTEGE